MIDFDVHSLIFGFQVEESTKTNKWIFGRQKDNHA